MPWSPGCTIGSRGARTRSASSPRRCRPPLWARGSARPRTWTARDLMTLDYQKLNVVLWGVVKSLQKRVESLEKKRGRS